MTITRAEAADRMLDFAQKGLLVQMYWRKKEGRVERVCLLAAAGGPGVAGLYDCPASVMPPWMAHLIVKLFDSVSAIKATPLGIQFAEALRDGNVDDDVMRRWLIRLTEYALVAVTPKKEPHPDYWAPVKLACEQIIAAMRSADKDYVALTSAALAVKQSAGAAAQAARSSVGEEAQAAAGVMHVAHAAAAVARSWSVRRPEGDVKCQGVVWAASEAAWAMSAARPDGPPLTTVAYERLFIALIEEMTR